MTIQTERTEPICSWKAVLTGTLCVWLLAICAPVFEITNSLSFELGAVLLLAFGGVFTYTAWVKKDTSARTICRLLMLGAVVLRVYFTHTNLFLECNHDIGGIGETGEAINNGHLGYIEYIYKNWHLPDFDPREVWSFYNPPGFYIVGALVLRVTELCQPAPPYCYEALQCIPFFFCGMTLCVTEKILEQFPIAGKYRNLAVLMLAYHPFFTVLGAGLTNDAMAMFFSALAILQALAWMRERSFRRILLCALSVGLAMFTKLNAALVAIGIAFLFAWGFFTDLKSWKRYLLQGAAFLAVCVPLGLYYPVRNKILYDMPLLYIQALGTDNPSYITEIGGLDRVGLPSLESLLHPFWTNNSKVDVNIWAELLRTSLFDEFYNPGGGLIDLLALVLLWLAIFLAVVMLVQMAREVFCRKTLALWQRGFLGISYGTMVISFASFCFAMPYMCSMHYRYIPLAMVFPLIGSGVALSRADTHYKAAKILTGVFIGLSIVCVMFFAVFGELCNQ